MTTLAALLAVTDEVYIDGNSHGCRSFHAHYASLNSFHCPHISFVPMEDGNGKTKCQTSEGLQATDFFTETDLANFDTFMQENSDRVNYPDGYKMIDLEEMDEEEEEDTGSSSVFGGASVGFTALSAGLMLGLL